MSNFLNQKFYKEYFWSFFIFSLFLVSFCISALVPSFQSPDENDHVKRAYMLSRGQLLVETPPNGSSGGFIDKGLIRYMQAYEILNFKAARKLSADEIYDANQVQWSGTQSFSPTHGISYNFPLIYTPQALALSIGKYANFSINNSYLLARFFSLIFSCLILLWAFRIHPPDFLIASLLIIPMSLFQFGAASIDGISTALTILAISLFFRISKDGKNYHQSDLFFLFISTILICTCRSHLLPILLLLFTVYFYTKDKKCLIFGVLASLITLSWLIFVFKTTIDKNQLSGLAPTLILQFYLSHPIDYFIVLINTLSDFSITKAYFTSFIGVLGWLDTSFPKENYLVIGILLCLIFISSLSRNLFRDWTLSKILLCICSLISMLIIFSALLFTFTIHPAKVIMGIQGRYFLLPLILFAYAIQNTSRVVYYPQYNVVKNAGLFLLILLFLYSGYQTERVLLNRYFIASEISLNQDLKYGPSALLKNNGAVELHFLKKQMIRPAKLRGVSILFAKLDPNVIGSFELQLMAQGNELKKIPFNTRSIIPNAYTYFPLDEKAYISGKVISPLEGGIQVMESRIDNYHVYSCIIYELDDGSRRYTAGCP